MAYSLYDLVAEADRLIEHLALVEPRPSKAISSAIDTKRALQKLIAEREAQAEALRLSQYVHRTNPVTGEVVVTTVKKLDVELFD